MMTFDGYEMRVEDKFSKVSKIWASPRRGLELHASRLPLLCGGKSQAIIQLSINKVFLFFFFFNEEKEAILKPPPFERILLEREGNRKVGQQNGQATPASSLIS